MCTRNITAHARRVARALMGLAVLVGLAACVEPQRNALPDPAPDYASAWPVGFPNARIWGDSAPRAPEVEAVLRREILDLATGADRRLNVLALSGGGAEGAFGAGFLTGWSEGGTRPEFDIVTGVSTGAIIAPFAFLGAQYDDRLERFYTTSTTSDIVRPTFAAAVFRGASALGDTAPLRAVIRRELPSDLITRIADEHEKGRRLYIGTTNLDAQRPVIWDIGRIAAYRTPEAEALIRRIILASSAIPVAFPPVWFDATDGTTVFRELHADGAVTRNILVFPDDFSRLPAALRQFPGGTIWILHNGQLRPRQDQVTPRTIEIADRSLDTLIKVQTREDITTAISIGRRYGLRTRMATIPAAYEGHSNAIFDPVYMAGLFQTGRAKALGPSPWFRSLAEFDQTLPRPRAPEIPQ